LRCLPSRRTLRCLPSKRTLRCLPSKRTLRCLPSKRTLRCLPSKRTLRCDVALGPEALVSAKDLEDATQQWCGIGTGGQGLVEHAQGSGEQTTAVVVPGPELALKGGNQVVDELLIRSLLLDVHVCWAHIAVRRSEREIAVKAAIAVSWQWSPASSRCVA
jgi:hypothetical protein